MQVRRQSRNGQALIMVTLALIAMSGLIGMVVDFGWSYYVRRTAQSAADAAAMAAANSLLDAVVASKTFYPSGVVGPTTCATTFADYRQNACLYAEQNGFAASQIQVTAGNSQNYPPGVYAIYWVTVQISNTIPQLYSAVLGNPYATVAAKATAAIFDTPVGNTLIALNRVNDAQPAWQTLPPAGTKPGLVAGAGSSIGLGVVAIASDDSSASGYNLGVSPASSYSRGALQGSWTPSQQSQPDGSNYYDPFHGMGQPPLSSSAIPNQVAVPNGVLDPSTVPQCASGVCPPGVYYATTTSNGVASASGGPLTISGNVSFASSGSSFGDYVFYGGLNIASTSTVSFGPGRYVLAGVADPATTDNLYIAYGANVTGGTPSDAGRMFILTDPNYPGLQQIAPAPGSLASSLSFGQSVINGDSAANTLYGLNSSSTQSLPTDTNEQSSMLSDFAPVVMWQDQRFSYVSYTASGNIDTTCGSLEKPCTQTPQTPPQLTFGDGTNPSLSSLQGVVYQPRGGWMRILPNATVQGAVTLISGTLDVGPGAKALPTPPSRGQNRLRTHRVAIVE
jgi:hypothetical protein